MPCCHPSSLFKKYVMAITGLMLFGFVIMHLLGNLQMFIGREAVNHYAATLQGLGGLLWVARFILLGTFAAHIITAVQLTRENRAARPVPYYKEDTIQASAASRTMMLSGLLILSYVIYHLLHFTLHVVHTTHHTDHHGAHDVYQMVVDGFSQPLITGVYVFAMIVLGAHLSHGATSVFQSLGLNTPKYQKYTRLVGPVLGFAIALGYCSIPVAVLAGLIK